MIVEKKKVSGKMNYSRKMASEFVIEKIGYASLPPSGFCLVA
jgi:hypothetical protein